MGEAREANLKTFILVLAATAVALCATWIYWFGLDVGLYPLVGTVILASFALLGDVFPVRVSERTAISAGAISLMMAVAIFGPTWAALAAIPSALFIGRGNLLRTVYEIGHSVTTVFLAGIVFSFVSEPVLVGNPAPTTTVIYGTFLAGATLVAATGTINGLLLRIKYGQTLWETWKEILKPYLPSDAVNVLTTGLGVLALLEYGPVAAMIVVLGSLGSQALVYRSREQVKEIRGLEARVGSLEEALTTSNTAFGTMIIEDLGRKDGYTHRHAIATAVYAHDLAREMKLDESHAGRLRMAGLLHNVGMFGLPEDILTATGKLNSIAQSRLAEHPEHGERILAAVPEFEEMARWVRWHHERPDGRGYPDKLRGPWIPLEAKILAAAQTYAAEILDKPSRPGVSPEKAREMLVAGADTEFDGVVVRAFLRILDTEAEGYRMADDHRFAFPTPRVSADRDRAREGSSR